MSRFPFLVSVIGLLMIAGPVQAEKFQSVNGVVLPAPDLNVMTCEKLNDLMTMYSASHYRDIEVIPVGHPDRAIYEYENRLAEIHYQDCQVGSHFFEDASPAFSKGFN